MRMLPFVESLREERSEIETRIDELRRAIEEQLSMLKAVKRDLELSERERVPDFIELPTARHFDRPSRVSVEVEFFNDRRPQSLN